MRVLLKRNNAKITLSEHRFRRIQMMDGNVYGYLVTQVNNRTVRAEAFVRGDYVYGLSLDKNGAPVYTRYHLDTYKDWWAFREYELFSPHSPF